ncbi:MAG: hypothetical protein GSR85_02660 [Desulfurococcales archaeon]|nr:hypothetical protein [Desulfurococcales archaeon]
MASDYVEPEEAVFDVKGLGSTLRGGTTEGLMEASWRETLHPKNLYFLRAQGHAREGGLKAGDGGDEYEPASLRLMVVPAGLCSPDILRVDTSF